MPKPIPNHSLCGDVSPTQYRSASQICCRAQYYRLNIFLSGNFRTRHTYMQNKEIWAKSSYPPYVLNKQSKDDHRCCGRRTYNPSTHFCCDYHVYPNMSGDKCCGKRIYDPNEQLCCGTRLYWKRVGNGVRCCGGEAFNATSEICCGGMRVQKSRLPPIQWEETWLKHPSR